ncbi:AAA family ATPase [Streptomyces sp. NBC_00103]|uniref:AAA family ATPase n=1 Tax=Streptomyces sp. NBC_00103 TaxID=2975653 RepID=UPI002254CA05|nr:AAA family ATPase [Streptomyces sp. NBC_00103]MCX5367962.1 ATP-binding protein [Streptomyces sp. NBC_00103]
MLFTTPPSRVAAKPNHAALVRDNWDDYGFKTTFDLYCHNGIRSIHVGAVKIARRGMISGRIELPETFTYLGDEFFSLGVDESYYATLRDEFNEDKRLTIYQSLRDAAFDTVLFDDVLNESVMAESLLRGTDADTAREQYHRIANGGPTRSKFHVRFRQEISADNCPDLKLDLKVDPNKNPPSNIQALIGSNGVGKTRLLHKIADVTLSRRTPLDGGSLEDRAEHRVHPFNNVVYVSFSAFDTHKPHRARHRYVAYQYVGLKTAEGQKSQSDLADEFAACVVSCTSTNRAMAERWRGVLERLEETDAYFDDMEISQLGEPGDEIFDAASLFSSLSSGHAIVLLTLAQLVLNTTERTLVLIDEPEAHLHPPLLSTFIRVLSELLADRNGLAIVATHSPVVLQETPREAVWSLHRAGDDVRADHPDIETFGENVSVITREIFGLEVRRTGFNQLIQELADTGLSFEEILNEFDDKLGAEGRALARSATRRREGMS